MREGVNYTREEIERMCRLASKVHQDSKAYLARRFLDHVNTMGTTSSVLPSLNLRLTCVFWWVRKTSAARRVAAVFGADFAGVAQPNHARAQRTCRMRTLATSPRHS